MADQNNVDKLSGSEDDDEKSSAQFLNGTEAADPDDAEIIHEEDLVRVIELDEGNPADDVANEMDDMELDEQDNDEDTPPIQDDSQLVFTRHTDSVYCVRAIRNDQHLAVSGGGDNRAFVWNYTTGEEVFECTGHKDSVTCVGFNCNSQLVFTADLGGVIKVWDVATHKEVWSNDEVGDLEWAEWHPLASVLMAGTSDGTSYLWNIREASRGPKVFSGGQHACNMGRFLPDGKRACVGYGDGTVQILDLKEGSAVHNFTGHDAHSACITSMDCHPDNNLFLTGSADCTAHLFSSSAGKLISVFNCGGPEGDPGENSVEAVCFCSSLNAVSTGTLSGNLTLWDVPTKRPRQQFSHEGGIVRSIWDSSTSLLYTCTLDGAAHAWDARSGQRVKHWLGHEQEILDLELCAKEGVIMTASEDNSVRVFPLT